MIAGSPDSPVNAVAAIAPPTDLANWGKPSFLLVDDPQMAVFAPPLGIDPKAPKKDNEARVRKLSPITFVNPKYPPTLIVHGDGQDRSSSAGKTMDQALSRRASSTSSRSSRLHYDEKTFGPGLKKALQWFKDKLLK
jgi:hypothetical protein